MKNILLQVKADSVVAETISNTDSTTFSIWFWVAIIELVIIVFLFFKTKEKRKRLEIWRFIER